MVLLGIRSGNLHNTSGGSPHYSSGGNSHSYGLSGSAASSQEDLLLSTQLGEIATKLKVWKTKWHKLNIYFILVRSFGLLVLQFF